MCAQSEHKDVLRRLGGRGVTVYAMLDRAYITAQHLLADTKDALKETQVGGAGGRAGSEGVGGGGGAAGRTATVRRPADALRCWHSAPPALQTQ